jgi:uncharacterized membrane protein YgaE (UPF0421/DUF939 family)
MTASHIQAVTFSFKAALGAIIAAYCYRFATLPGSPWVAAVSAVLVTQPDLHGSLKASLLRVSANLAGALGGEVLLALTGQPLLAMGLGIVLTGLVCHLLKQDDALRPAFVAVIIVTLTGDNGRWQNGADRVAAVIIGCACALVVGFLYDKISGLGSSTKTDTKTGTQE